MEKPLAAGTAVTGRVGRVTCEIRSLSRGALADTLEELFDGVVPAKAVCERVWWGAVAQLGERLVRNEEVSGSIPLSSTNKTITYPENLGQ